jgi:hypothetical protein
MQRVETPIESPAMARLPVTDAVVGFNEFDDVRETCFIGSIHSFSYHKRWYYKILASPGGFWITLIGITTS